MKRNRVYKTGRIGEEVGQALVLMLVFLLMGSLALGPVLAHVSTALKTSSAYEYKANEFNTADAGIENGMWRIKYDFLGSDYDPYDFDSVWEYNTGDVNSLSANVNIQNVWFPSNVTLDSFGLDAADARAIIESDKMIISGTSGANPGQPFHIKMEYHPDTGDNLTITSIGVWLPQGFEYDEAGDCTLMDNPLAAYYPESLTIDEVPGGTTVVWSYEPDYPLFSDFPNFTSENSTLTTTFEFEYYPPADDPDLLPLAVAWVTCEMHDGYGNPVLNPTAAENIPIVWDTDMRYYKIASSAGDTDIEAYSSKSQLRSLGNAIAGDYAAIGNSLMIDTGTDHIRDSWRTPSSYTLTQNPADADVIAAYLYWSGWRNDTRKTTVFTDSCAALTNWDYGAPTAWSVASSSYFKGHYSSGGASAKLLTLKTARDLSSYVPGTTIVTWKQSTPLVLSDSCGSLGTYWTNGGDWVVYNNQFRARSSAAADDPSRLLTLTSAVDLSYTTAGAATVSWDQWENGSNIAATDGLDFAFSMDNGATWLPNITAFRDDISGTQHFTCSIDTSNMTGTFKMRFQLVGFPAGGINPYCYIDNIAITPVYSALDGLDIAISTDDGATWSQNEEIFRGDIGNTASVQDYYIPAGSDTATFKVRFQAVGMSGPGQSVALDDIKIINLPPDTSITFKINDQQVYLDAGGDPQAGAQPLTSTRSYARANYLSGATQGFSYASIRDVTALVKKYPVVAGETNHTGNAKYTVDAVSADLSSHFSFAGWSLIIIYGSPATAGHYLYLWDENFAYHPGTGGNLDWDGDGDPGGDISGFLFPEPIKNKDGTVRDEVSARLTCCVVEGDANWSPDSVEVTGQQSLVSDMLANTSSIETNVWDGLWPHEGSVYEGIDIDTFEILWTDNIFTPKDTRLTIDLVSGQDSYNLVYLILSVRSETVTSSTGHYVIDGN